MLAKKSQNADLTAVESRTIKGPVRSQAQEVSPSANGNSFDALQKAGEGEESDGK